MKKIILLALASGFVFNSCTTDDEDDFNNEFSLVGVWQPSRKIVMSGDDGVTIYNTNFDACYATSTFDFRANNTVVTNIFETNISGTCASTGVETSPYSYDHDNKKLVIDGENIEVISRTSNELQFVSHYDDVDGDGTDDKIIYVLFKT
ncbi:lipocalin family protein [Chryseobacterium sp.]|uniref:lipocalin family protein n=1 Tax=Chryseobacterium sp. TaxID=1871047 RepID=UPI0028A27187|nr:lipocalin family protein [Chryseobacterium sp.]